MVQMFRNYCEILGILNYVKIPISTREGANSNDFFTKFLIVF